MVKSRRRQLLTDPTSHRNNQKEQELYLVLRAVPADGLASEGLVHHAGSRAEKELGGACDPSPGVTVQLR